MKKEKQFLVIPTIRKQYKNKLLPLLNDELGERNVDIIQSTAIKILDIDEFFKFIGLNKKIIYGILKPKINLKETNTIDIIYLNKLYKLYTNNELYTEIGGASDWYYSYIYHKGIPLLNEVKENAIKLCSTVMLYEPELKLFHSDTYIAMKGTEFDNQIEEFISNIEALKLAVEVS